MEPRPNLCFANKFSESIGNLKTRTSAMAEGPRDALSQFKSCQLLHNCTKSSDWENTLDNVHRILFKILP